jgi:hypothetical protein
LLNPGFGIEHGKAFVVLAGKGKHFHTALFKKAHPFLRIKSGGVPRFIKFVVGLPFGKRFIQEGPGFATPLVLGRIQAPVYPYAIFDIQEGFIGFVGGPPVCRNGNFFDVGTVPHIIYIGHRKLVRKVADGPAGGIG